ncbi:MAG: threonine ammonia-lyase [Thermomicrobiales bacterium]
MTSFRRSGQSGAVGASFRSSEEIATHTPEPPIDMATAHQVTTDGDGGSRSSASWTDVTLQDIFDARTRISPHLGRTPMLTSRTLSAMTETDLGMKAELFQRTGSFKSRGALNAALLLTPEQKDRGLITISAGNHGQGLAFAGTMVGTKTVVFMPRTAVPTKIEAIRNYGAEIHLTDSMSDVFERMDAHRIEHDLTYVSPFDDAAIIAGQGTVGLEILEDMPDVENIVVQAGGGGLLAGVALAVKSQRPDVRVIGFEPKGANTVRRSLDSGRQERTGPIETVADGLAAPFAGDLTQAIIAHCVDDVILLDEEEIVNALRLILERVKVIVEPAGAASLAGLLSGRTGAGPGSKTVVILTGGNVDRDKLKSLL